MNRPKIAVLFGGCSSEHHISLLSAASVVRNLDAERYEPILIGITREGVWLRYLGGADEIAADAWHKRENCVPVTLPPCRATHGIWELRDGRHTSVRIDAALPILHGRFGEDGTVQGLLELAGIPVIGCDTLSSALCMDKYRAHSVVQAAGIRVPRGLIIDTRMQMDAAIEQACSIGFPLIVKPLRAGSSLGIHCVNSEFELRSALTCAFQYDSRAVVEEFIHGFEVGCAIMGWGDELVVGEVDEIELLSGDFFDYTDKYTERASRIHMPARILDAVAREIQAAAKTVYRALGCGGFARVDLFFTRTGEIVFNEVNTIPGLTAKSRYPIMLQGIGYGYRDMLDYIIGSTLATS